MSAAKSLLAAISAAVIEKSAPLTPRVIPETAVVSPFLVKVQVASTVYPDSTFTISSAMEGPSISIEVIVEQVVVKLPPLGVMEISAPSSIVVSVLQLFTMISIVLSSKV